MSSSKCNNSGFGLSLSGSQIGTPTSSARQSSRSSARESQSAFGTGARQKTSTGRPRSGSVERNTPRSQRSSRGPPSTPKKNGSSAAAATDDFLALFDSTNQPKIMKPKAKPGSKGAQPKQAWGSAKNSARSGTTVTSKQTRGSSQGSKFSHSVFEPVSARTNSTMGDEDDYQDGDYVYRNYQQSPKEVKANRNRTTPSDRGDYNLHLAIPDDDNKGRNSSHGENDLSSSGRYDSSSDKATKLNSIANNMTSLALSPSTKAPFHGMENSYQNIKHKHPVNQVKQSSVPNHSRSLGRNDPEDYIKKVNMAATQIQRWFRRHSSSKSKAGEAALKRLLDSKKKEKIQEMELERKSVQEDRKKTKEERQRQARLEAIEELQKKREAKRQHGQEMINQDMKYLQESGKVTKTPSGKSNVKNKVAAKSKVSSARKGGAAAADAQPPVDRSPPQEQAEAAADDECLEEVDNPEQSTDVETPSKTGTKTTLDDLMDTLNKLEADDHHGKATARKNENPLAWLDELEKSSNTEEKDSHFADNVVDKDNIMKSEFLSEEKLRNIKSYLDEMDTAERLTVLDQELSNSTEALFNPPLLVPSQEDMTAIEQASQHAAEVTNSMLSLKLELEEKRRTVQMLKRSLTQQQELTVRNAKMMETEMRKRIELQKNEYEADLDRRMALVDELMECRTDLTGKCAVLAKELKATHTKYDTKISSMTESHKVELKKAKELQSAAEKLRMEKWKETKARQIKDQTIRGLHPEIERIIAQHHAEIRKLKSIHEAELLASDEKAGGRYVHMTEELRDQLTREKEAAIERERELAEQRQINSRRQEEEAYQQQRRRLHAEVQEEKDRLAQQAAKQRAQFDQQQRELEEAKSAAMASMKKEFEKKHEEQERRHAEESKQLHEKMKLEKEAWEENLMKKQQTWCMQKERELKESVKKDRDREINIIIEKLDAEHQSAREECERTAEYRIDRIKNKQQAVINELERSEREIMEKYNKNKAILAEFEGENERYKVLMRQKDIEVLEMKKLLEKFNKERDSVSDVIRQDFADRIVTTEEENKRIKNEMSELKARHRLELEKSKAEVERVIAQKEEEMGQLHDRVKQAVTKKEEIINKKEQEKQAALKRAEHLEGLLEQQRKQLLGKK